MGCSQPVSFGFLGDEVHEHYWREGYAIVRRLFSVAEVQEIADAADQVCAEGRRTAGASVTEISFTMSRAGSTACPWSGWRSGRPIISRCSIAFGSIA
jgi:hypothetical protein